MSEAQASDADLLFAEEHEEEAGAARTEVAGWKLLIVDDEPAVHDVTRLALSGFEFDGRPLQYLHAHSGQEARQVLEANPDVAVALVDVVMEHEHAGLDLIRDIREAFRNRLIRLILRTGQPGQAPERKVIRSYDINDYKEKADLSAQKLYSTVLTSLRSYRDLVALDANRRGLEQVIRASGRIFELQGLNGFIQGVLEQLIALLYLGRDSLYVNSDSIALESKEERVMVVAATGQFAPLLGCDGLDRLPDPVAEVIAEVMRTKAPVVRDGSYAGYFRLRSGREDVIYIASSRELSPDDSKLIQLFLHNAAIAYENALLRDEIEGTQRDMVYMLGEAIETRSRETGQHVRRVAEYCALIAEGIGLSRRDVEVLRMAAPLHDFGKVGIPDAILHKPGALDPHEWETMKTHAEIGREMLSRSRREILKSAALLAGHHHEKWDGSGYPEGLAGEEIHIYGRIGAVADVFDALGSRRSYKEPWPQERIVEYLREQRGRQFDPVVVDWVLENMDSMVAVRERFPDGTA